MIVAAVMAWGKEWCNKQLIIYTDSLVIACVWRTGTSRDKQLMDLVCWLFTFIVRRNINIHMTHIPGLTNKKADTLSRLQFQEFHKCFPDVERLPRCGATSHTGPASSLEHLEVERRRYLSAALATTSLQVYQTALTQYLHFCIQVGVNPYPLQEHVVELFSTSLACRVGYKTIKAYLYCIQFHGSIQGYHHKIMDMPRLGYILLGIRHTQGARHSRPRRRPITLTHKHYARAHRSHTPQRGRVHVKSDNYRSLFQDAESIRIHLHECAQIRCRTELDATGHICTATHGHRTYKILENGPISGRRLHSYSGH